MSSSSSFRDSKKLKKTSVLQPITNVQKGTTASSSKKNPKKLKKKSASKTKINTDSSHSSHSSGTTCKSNSKTITNADKQFRSSINTRDSKNLKKKSTSKLTQKPLMKNKIKKKKGPKSEPSSRNVGSFTSIGLKWDQEKPREWDPYEDGDYSKMPYETPNAVNFIGGIGANTGHDRSKRFINRPTAVEQIYNMRNDNKPIFSFIEDPREANNLPSKGHAIDYDEKFMLDAVNKIRGIKHEQYLETIEESEPSLSDKSPILKQTDTDSNTDYVEINRERNYELRQTYLAQRRALKQAHIATQLPIDLGFEYRKEKFKLSEYYDLDKVIPEEEEIESAKEVVVDWTDTHRVESHECDLKFARIMPQAIPSPTEREKLAFLTRTLDKPQNAATLDQELQVFSKSIEACAKEDIKHQDAARQLKKMLNKQKIENLPIDLAVKDFDEFLKATGVFNVHVADKKTDDLTSDDNSRRDRLVIAMKDFEEKITERLSVMDDMDSFANIPESSMKSETSNRTIQSKQHCDTKDEKMPVDFTYPFDTSLNEKLKQFIRAEYKSLSKEGIDEDLNASTELSTSEMNLNNIELVNEANDRPHLLFDEHSKSQIEPTDKVKRKANKDIKRNDSFCTNFTDDSGSYIILQDKKLHLDYLKTSKKSSQQQSEKLKCKFDEYLRPYIVLPLPEVKKLAKRDPKLVPTFDIKERLKIEIPRYQTELLGTEENKYNSQLATEWDEYYQKEILNRPSIRRFKPRTIMKQIVDSLRLKYESIYKREYLTEKTIIIEQEKLFIKQAEKFRDVCMAFFSNLQTTRYRQSMAMIQELRPIYELNDKLMSDFTIVNNQLIQLKTAIIRAEGKHRETTILQNVSYLMKDPNWRDKNDWIHKRSDGTFETIKESIEKRMTTNLRKKDSDNVWVIKQFFEKYIFPNRRPALVAFENPDAINATIANLKVQLYLSLLKLDLSTWTIVNLKHAYNAYTKWSSEFINQRQKYVEARCARKYFQEDCAANLKMNAVELIHGKLVETISEKTLRTLDPLCNVLYVSLVPENVQEQFKDADMLEKFRLITLQAMNLLEQLDTIPAEKRKNVENKMRRESGFIARRTKRAIDLENYINNVKKIMVKHSTPTYKRPPRVGKLPRSFLPKPKQLREIIDLPDADGVETVSLTIKKGDFEQFSKEVPPPPDFYLDAKFFGANAEIPNIDFLPEMKSNINEFIIDVKRILKNWDKHREGRYLEDAHIAWTAEYSKI